MSLEDDLKLAQDRFNLLMEEIKRMVYDYPNEDREVNLTISEEQRRQFHEAIVEAWANRVRVDCPMYEMKELDEEEDYELVSCTCACHTSEYMVHMMPCCKDGFISIKKEKE